MRALTWQGRRSVSVETVPDPVIQEPNDAVIRVTSTAICGSDLHLYEVLGMFIDQGDILGHEPMGIVEEVGSGVSHIEEGDRVRVFNLRGEITLVAHVNGAVRPGVVAARLNWAKLSPNDTNINVLTSDRLTDLGAGATFYSALVQVEKAPPQLPL